MLQVQHHYEPLSDECHGSSKAMWLGTEVSDGTIVSVLFARSAWWVGWIWGLGVEEKA